MVNRELRRCIREVRAWEGDICTILDSIEEDKLLKLFCFNRICHSMILDLTVLYLYLPMT